MRNNRPDDLFQQKGFISESETTFTLVACMNRIFRKVDAEGLNEETLEAIGLDIDYVASRFAIDREGAVLLAAILEKSPSNNRMDEEDLARYLGCTNIEFIRYRNNLQEMMSKGIIEAALRGPRRSFCVVPPAMEAIEKNGPFTPRQFSGLSAEELFLRFGGSFERFRYDEIDANMLTGELDTIVSNNSHLPFCRLALDSPLYDKDCPATERRIFYFLSFRYVLHGNLGMDLDTLSNFMEFMEPSERLKRRVAEGRTFLQKKGLADFVNEDGFVNTDALGLSDKVKETFFQGVELTPEEKVSHRDVIPSGSIKPKDLFFNERERAQVARLEGLLDMESFRRVQDRLQEVGMRRGFNAVFYGAPGTGKTASVYELARRSGRDIFHVDMTKLKSKWVGESEKSVRGVFRMYRSMCRGGKAPILLFNEADAIFSRRIENVEQSTDQMNNAIQNIILEEMESIDGILIATTNLLSNLDPAFERRFLFKVEFRLPEKESRTKIWKSMIPSLSEEDAEALAGRFAFSGGNIENVARKSMVEYVLSGNRPTLETLETYCEEEILRRKDRPAKIGF